jgi:hypothetical protein
MVSSLSKRGTKKRGRVTGNSSVRLHGGALTKTNQPPRIRSGSLGQRDSLGAESQGRSTHVMFVLQLFIKETYTRAVSISRW